MIIRIDKGISSIVGCSRNDVKNYIKQHRVLINNMPVHSGSQKFDTEKDIVTLNGEELRYSQYVYIMMNKPKGVISASKGEGEKTVIDILPPEMKRKNLFPAGRLDKDTTGFVLITDDGNFAHDILSPKKHVEKTYVVTLSKAFDENVVKAFGEGVTIGGDKCLEASIKSLNDDNTVALVVLKQGLYHQIKRMFRKFDIDVVELKRIKIGALSLDENLAEGECRYITESELDYIKMHK